MRRQLLAATLCVAALSACGDDSATTSEPGASAVTLESVTPASEAPSVTQVVETSVVEISPASTQEPAVTTAEVAPEVLQFAAPLLGGGMLDFTTYAGRPVALWFWAPT